MNILHVVPSVDSQSYGLGQVAINLMKAQREIFQNSEIWCFDKQETVERVIIENNLPKDSIKGFGYIGIGKSRLSIKIFFKLFAKHNNFEIIHQHGIWTLVSLWTLLYSRKFKIKSIIAPHGSLEKTALEKSKSKKKLALLMYEKANLRNAAAFHATSINEVNDFKKFGIKKRIFLINNGISKDWINTTAHSGSINKFLCKLSLEPNQRIILYMSRVTPKKNLGALIKAWASVQKNFQNWHLVIIGGDEMGYKQEMQNLVKELDISSRATFCEPLFGQEKIDAFAASEIFVLPSLSEGFPIVILDSLGAGVPVLTNRELKWNALEEYHCGWLSDPTDIGLEKVLKEILCLDTQVLHEMGNNGKKLVSEKFLWDIIAKQTVAQYKNILNCEEKLL